MLAADAIAKRFTVKTFQKERTIPDETLRRILALTQRAPTGFNSQPYIAVVVKNTSPEHEKLIEAMFEGNQSRVKDASLTVVFCGDLEPSRLVDRMADLSAKLGYDREESRKKLQPIMTAVGSHILPLRWFIGLATTLLLPIVGLVQPVMTGFLGESTRTWAIKQATFACATFLIAASAEGVNTAPMEGFDTGRVRAALGIPSRYLPCLVVPCGYAEKGEPKHGLTHRCKGEEVFFDGNFETPLEGIKPWALSE